MTQYDDELMHYGVPGMKWGHRKQTYSDSYNNVKSTKAAYKQASKEYNKSYRKASNYSSHHPISQYVGKKQKTTSDKYWTDAVSKASKANRAHEAYKSAKKENRQAINSTYKQIKKDASIDSKLMFNDATRHKAAKYVVNNNMSISEANKKASKEAIRNTALLLGAYGAVKIGAKAISNYTGKQAYQVLDATGKVLKNYRA